ncbi:hypothetical protein ACFZBU_16475 [Embleya sp. NPDC008237]|uniref:hypothetical protein n=1 Tax=Embleya sp. NPDC008237 TaxID=3363978 RepID=UPI0036E231C3
MTIDRRGTSNSADPTRDDPSGGGPALHEPRWWPYVRDIAPTPPADADAGPGSAGLATAGGVTAAEAEAELAGLAPAGGVTTGEVDASHTQFLPAVEAIAGERRQSVPDAENAASIPAPPTPPAPVRNPPPAREPEPEREEPSSPAEEPSTREEETTYAPLARAMDPKAEQHHPMPAAGASPTAATEPAAATEPEAATEPDGGTGTESRAPVEAPAKPEPAEEFGWDFRQVSTESADWFPAPKRRPRWVVFVIAGLVVMVIASACILVLAGREEQPVAQPTTAAPVPATVMAPDAAAPYRPQGVSVKSFEGRLLVFWKPPQRTDLIVGYLVVAQSRDGAVQKTEVPRAGELTAVLAGAPVGPNSCVVVTTLVSGTPSMMMSRSDPVCPRASATRSEPPATADSADPSEPGASGE